MLLYQSYLFTASAGTLKDGRYNVAGYIIDIQNGVRVNSALTKPANPIKRKARLSNPSDILNQPDNLAPSNNRTVLPVDSNLNSEYNVNNNVDSFNKNHFNSKMYNLPVTNQKTICNYQVQPFKGHRSSSDSVCSSDSLNKISDDLKVSSATKVTFSEHIYRSGQSTFINNDASSDVATYTTEQLLEQMQKNLLSTINETTAEGSQSFNSMVLSSPRVNKVAVVSPRVLNDEKIMGDNKGNMKCHSNSMIALSLKDSLDAVNSSLSRSQDTFKHNAENKYSSFITGNATIKTLNQQVPHKQPYPEKIDSSKSSSTSTSSLTPCLNSFENVKPTYLSSSSNHVATTYSKEINSSVTSSSQSSRYSSVVSNIKFSSKPSSESSVCGSVVYPTTNAGVHFFNANHPLRMKMENQSAELPTKHFASDINMQNETKYIPYHLSHLNQPVNPYSSGFPNTMNKNEKNNTETDQIYREAQQNFAGLTFEKIKLKTDENFLNNFNDSKVNENLEINSNFSCKNLDVGFEENIHNSALPQRSDSALPLRSDSNTGRQGRLIVSADSKKRLKTDFTPHPPLKPKSAKDSRQALQNNNPILRFESDDILNTAQFSRLNSYNLASINNSFVKHARSISADAPTESVKTELAQKPHVTFSNDLKNNFNSYLLYQPTGKYLEASQQSKKKGFPVALNKTPTDDEINNLWENVRQCLSTESSGRQAHSDIVAVTQVTNQSPRNSNHSQIYRSLSASSYRRYNSLENSIPKKQHSVFYQSNNTNASVSNRQALLPQRAIRMIKNPKITSKLDINQNNLDWGQRNHGIKSTIF